MITSSRMSLRNKTQYFNYTAAAIINFKFYKPTFYSIILWILYLPVTVKFVAICKIEQIKMKREFMEMQLFHKVLKRATVSTSRKQVDPK